jgi:hypothetical protein
MIISEYKIFKICRIILINGSSHLFTVKVYFVLLRLRSQPLFAARIPSGENYIMHC